MSASTLEVPSVQRPGSRWKAPLFRWSEVLIAVLWIAGELRYWRQGGHYSLALLVGSILLLGPRLIQIATRRAARGSTAPPHVWLLLLGAFLPEHLMSVGSVVLPHVLPLLLAAACGVADLFVGSTTSADRWISLNHRAAKILAAFVVAYGTVGTILAIAKLHTFGYVGQDIGYFMQCLYTAMHGELFAGNQYHDLLYTGTVTSDFASHNQPVLFLLLPVYWTYPHAETLFLFRNLCVAFSAYPAYRLARFHLQPFPALAITLAYLLAPAVLFQNFYDFAPLSLVALPLLFALLFYERRQFVPYLASLLLCLFVREDLAIVVISLGAVALLSRRDAKWSAVPAALGIAWALLSWGYLLPHFQQGSPSAVETCFAYLGSTPTEMARNLLYHPQLVFTHKAITYSKQLFTPLGLLLPFCSPTILAALPLYVINVLGDPGCNSGIIFRHYALIPSILMLPGAVYALKWIGTRAYSPAFRVGTVALALFLASTGTTLLSISANELGWWHSSPWHAEARSVARQIPSDAAVAVPRYMLPLAANRERVYQSLRLLDYHHPDAAYVIIDRDKGRTGLTPTWEDHYSKLLSLLQDPSRFEIVYSSQNYLVYHRTGRPLASLRPVAGARGK